MYTKDNKNLHKLIIGGTGMLKKTSLFLTYRGYSVSILARNKDESFSEGVHWIQVDYHNTSAFISVIQMAEKKIGVVDDIICWMHGSATNSFLELVHFISKSNTRLLHVLGSSLYRPDAYHEPYEIAQQILGDRYRQVILGFVKEGNTSRWLTHDEISSGVIDAFLLGKKIHIIGQIEPWGDKP